MKNRRKKKYVDSVVQGALARRICLHWIAFALLAAVVFPVFRVFSGFQTDLPFMVQVNAGLASLAPLLIGLVALMPIFVYDTIKCSHRVAGPIYRMHRTIRELGEGKRVEPIQLRRGDAWTAMAEDINAVIERIDRLNERANAPCAVESEQSADEDERELALT